MDNERTAALLEPFLDHSLSESQLEHISIYIDLLLRWNARINLTAIRKEEEIVTRHFGESFFLARHLFPRSIEDCRPERSQAKREAPAQSASPSVIDIGSGAGFPALPLKLWAPQIHLTLIESNHKKAAFLQEVVRSLTLTNVDVIAERAETLIDLPRAEVVTLRAVERFETILPQAVRFLAPNGRLALMIGGAQRTSLARVANLHWQPPIPIPLSENRILAIGCADK